jgi:hypothetical protein
VPHRSLLVSGGQVTVPPAVFHSVMDGVPAEGWQLVQEPDRLAVLLAGTRTPSTAMASRVGSCTNFSRAERWLRRLTCGGCMRSPVPRWERPR